MAKFVSKDGKHTIETSHKGEQVSLRAQGYREQKAAPKAAQQPSSATQGGSDKSSK